LADTKPDPAKLTFEDAINELEKIVSQLEGGQTSLEESIGLYERGEKLKARCEALLKNAEMRIEKITLGPDGGAKGAEPLDVDR
jgi:exodeoxyribonuclease VII small subunit